MTRVTLSEIKKYFEKHVGPVFCEPSSSLLHMYKKMEGMIGIIHPLVNQTSQLLEVDWSLDPQWHTVCGLYPSLENMSYASGELNIIRPGADIPQMCDLRYAHDWRPSKLGDVVCVSHHRFSDLYNVCPEQAIPYSTLLGKLGVVVEKHGPTEGSAMVTFTGQDDSEVVNIPSDLLIHLPNSFRPTQNRKKETVATQYSRDTKRMPRYNKGDTVRISTSYDDEQMIGLLAKVYDVCEVQVEGYHGGYRYDYTLDFDLLPNRNLALCESGIADVISCLTCDVQEKHLEKWNEKVSDKPYFGMYKIHSSRDEVWVRHFRELGTVDIRSNPDKSVAEGMDISVKVDDVKSKMSCRDVDYKYDPDVLLNELGQSFVHLGVEKDSRNPNIPEETHVYLYAFKKNTDLGSKLHLRILLGSLITRKSTQKKFVRALLGGKLYHPWSVLRYLQLTSLGYIYKITDASSYIEKAGNFVKQN